MHGYFCFIVPFKISPFFLYPCTPFHHKNLLYRAFLRYILLLGGGSISPILPFSFKGSNIKTIHIHVLLIRDAFSTETVGLIASRGPILSATLTITVSSLCHPNLSSSSLLPPCLVAVMSLSAPFTSFRVCLSLARALLQFFY